MLTDKQEKFCQNIINGMSQADAYRAAYNTNRMTNKSVWEKASELARNDKVAARVAELRQELAQPAIMSAQERLRWLSELIQSEEDTNAKLKAIDIMNKMQGEYTQKIEASVTNEVTINIELVEDE